MPKKVVVIGQGYVGLPVAMLAVEAGFAVVGLDIDPRRVEALANGTSFVEDISDATLASALDSGRYTPSADYAAAAGFDIAVISVPTPLRDSLPDLSFIEEAGRSLAVHLTSGATVILESTTYPGTTEELLVPILESVSGLKAGPDFHVGYSPERIDPGNARWNLATTPKVVSGIDDVEIDTNIGNHSIQGEQPRTAIGVIDENHIVIVVVDGRSPGYSAGVTMSGLADIMVSLGATTAYNLDGGGSSEMWFNGTVVNKPSNGGERATSDILYIAAG